MLKVGGYALLTGLFGGCVWGMTYEMPLVSALITIVVLSFYWVFQTLAIYLILEKR